MTQSRSFISLPGLFHSYEISDMQIDMMVVGHSHYSAVWIA